MDMIEIFILYNYLRHTYIVTNNFHLSVVNIFFDKFVIESENGILVLHPKDGFGSFVLQYCDHKFGVFLL